MLSISNLPSKRTITEEPSFQRDFNQIQNRKSVITVITVLNAGVEFLYMEHPVLQISKSTKR